MKNKSINALRKYFGFKDFKEGQELIINSILNKIDTLGIMPTGAGKSICYQIPALCFENLTIVISPLISLMKDQFDYLKTINYPAGIINSTVSFADQMEIKKKIENNRIKLLYLTPERFRNNDFMQWLENIKISCFVIDEAHCISEWGHDFRPEYRRLAEVIKKLNHPPVLALTATATKDVSADISLSLNMNNPNVFVSGFNRENLIYGVQKFFSRESKNRALIDFINKVASPGIIYTSSVKDAESIHNILRTNTKKKLGIYHGTLAQETRKKNQEDFLNDRSDILIATNAFGMGVNKKNIRFVVHYSIPGSIEAYYQETGRAGRDGKTSYCLLLYLEEDKNIQEFFIKAQNPPLKNLTDILSKLTSEAKKRILYSGDIENSLDNTGYGNFMINTILKQLHFIGCLDFEYVANEKIEINIEKTDINFQDRSFLEQIFSNTLEKKKFISLPLQTMIKRLDYSEKEFRSNLEKIAKNGSITFKVIKKGRIIKLLEKEIPARVKKEYSLKLKKKIEIDKNQLQSVIDYCDIENSCRRKYLLNYFGEIFNSDNCKKCDICRGTYKEEKLEYNEIQKNLLSFFIQNEGKIGKTKSIKILKGSIDLEPKYREWDEYGMLKKYDIRDIEDEFNNLMRNKLIEYSNDKYFVVKFTKKGLEEVIKIGNKKD